MFVRIGNGKLQYVKSKVLLKIGDDFKIVGYANNSKYYRVDFLTDTNMNISCVAYDWSEYLQILKYARMIVKN